MRYPPFAKSIYTKIYIGLLVASFLANRFVYGVMDYGNTLWYSINFIVALVTLIIFGIIGLGQGYKRFALFCFAGGLIVVLLCFLFHWALKGFSI